jgi:CDP-diacylglycerol---glycerol-3-phosphate 3-phosphatidyltransferase
MPWHGVCSPKPDVMRKTATSCTPNNISFLRVLGGLPAVAVFGRNSWLIALDALDGHITRTRKMARPEGAQIDILGDRVIENMYFTYFAFVGMVSLWLPMSFFARGAVTDFLRGLALQARPSGWGANGMLQNKWARAILASPWSRGTDATLKCLCFCYLGLQLALTRGPVALLGPWTLDVHSMIRTGAPLLAWSAAAFCVLRGLPAFLEGWKYFAEKLPAPTAKHEGNAA